jgi:hypothetical protein
MQQNRSSFATLKTRREPPILALSSDTDEEEGNVEKTMFLVPRQPQAPFVSPASAQTALAPEGVRETFLDGSKVRLGKPGLPNPAASPS